METELKVLCRIIFGSMAVVGFLSMWLSNIATCAMMIPVVAVVLGDFEAHMLGTREVNRQKRREFTCIILT